DRRPARQETCKTGDLQDRYCRGELGVPITFCDKFNPSQFRIVGNEYSLALDRGRGYVHGKRMYSRIFIQKIL
ncbi:adenine-specific methyltransferase EcoRI family protein, partial [bacterium 210702-DFI.5.13]|nr:adenine-specific methyltransferase EcoRI family protein [bacterium 210702-DFI.5.13]